ncbi:hypothetical protein DFJ58DRAFT_806169 [Suillus subalutaceus]|uniref:uncharacterized protein n=1 Tax=Suillus subalutaceus TaxID=48586 RepID=UPI001B86407F|nr:uncharacterized protein DFJ58DRAFT_806169 [Suillus subalutaceus]KAG1842518.1 hypothetical protein DFJ58DRAFT_806169 [Suillus subalutaceus]
MTAVGIQVAGLMMFLRVRAMYRDNRYVVILLASLLFLWVAVGAWLLSHGVACRMEFSDRVYGVSHPAWAWVPLCYDTVVFALTLNRTLPSIRNKEAGHVIYTLFTNGVLFYSVICAINLIFTVMIVRAPQGLKNITGQYVAMMSRITLSLKKEGTRGPACQRPVQDVMKPQPTPNSQTSPTRTELLDTQGHTGSLNGVVSSEGQRDNEVCTCSTCSAVTDAFDPADDKRSRYREAIV